MREAVLIKVQNRQEEIDHFRFMTLLKATLLKDNSSKDSFNDLKKLFQQYLDTLIPAITKERKDFKKDATKQYADFLKQWNKKPTTK